MGRSAVAVAAVAERVSLFLDDGPWVRLYSYCWMRWGPSLPSFYKQRVLVLYYVRCADSCRDIICMVYCMYVFAMLYVNQCNDCIIWKWK